jgi:hypothetical protein
LARRERRAKLIDEGRCIKCKDKMEDLNYLHCAPCREKQAAIMRQTSDRLGAPGKRLKARLNSERYDERKAQGLCPRCGDAPPLPDLSMCAVCLQRNRDYQQAYKRRRRQSSPHSQGPRAGSSL